MTPSGPVRRWRDDRHDSIDARLGKSDLDDATGLIVKKKTAETTEKLIRLHIDNER